MMPLHSSEVFSILIISSLSLITIFIYLFVKYQYSYWHRRNVKCLPPTFPFGNYRKNVLQILSIGEVCAEIYRNTNEPFIGVFGAFRPMLVICDPNLVRNIFVKDFHHFVDRGIYFDEKRDPLSAHLFTICGDKWKNLRSKLTPAFSSSRLRAMFSTLVECGLSLETVMEETAKNQKEFNVRECIACYSINVIASVAYGLDVDCILEPEHPFRQNGRKFFARSWRNGLRNFCRFVCPQLMHLLGMRFIDNDVEAFFFDLVERMIELREKQKIVRKDIFQMLIQLRNTGKVHENQWDTVIAKDEKNKMLTLNEMVAQVFVLFVAGFETSSSTISYCLYELAKNPDIQGQVQAEIDSVLAKTNGQITFDAVNEMKFLDACIDGSYAFKNFRAFVNEILLFQLCFDSFLVYSFRNFKKIPAITIHKSSVHRRLRHTRDKCGDRKRNRCTNSSLWFSS